MNIIYNKLLHTRLSHDFYSDGITNDFEIIPTSECNALMKGNGLLFKVTKDGFVVLYKAENETGNSPFIKLDENIKLVFYLKLKNSIFLNFTNLPLANDDKVIYYFTNRNNNIQNSELLLTSGTTGKYVSSADIIKLKPKMFTYSQNYPGASASISIADNDDNDIITSSAGSINGVINYDVDLSNYPPGRYKLKVDGVLKLDFYSDDTLNRVSAFGVMEFFNGADVPAGYKLTSSSGDITERNYKINFDNRKTTWKYYIVLKYRSTLNPSDLSLTYPDSTNSFIKGSTTTLSEGEQAIPFDSEHEIALKDTGIAGIKLSKTNGSGTGHFEIENLPGASTDYITPDSSTSKVYSEIYIYV